MSTRITDCDACAMDYVRWVRIRNNGGLCDVCGRDACVMSVPYGKADGDGEQDGDSDGSGVSTDIMSDTSYEHQEIDDVFSGAAGEYFESNIG